MHDTTISPENWKKFDIEALTKEEQGELIDLKTKIGKLNQVNANDSLELITTKKQEVEKVKENVLMLASLINTATEKVPELTKLYLEAIATRDKKKQELSVLQKIP
jgi:hypothetical protein